MQSWRITSKPLACGPSRWSIQAWARVRCVVRRVIAQRLTQSKSTVPHFYLTCDVTMDRLLALRHDVNAAAHHDRDGAAAEVLDHVVDTKEGFLAVRGMSSAHERCSREMRGGFTDPS